MKKPRLLDLYCKAGGASMGYSRAGFEVVGVDIEPQPRYPFPFILGDAIDVMTRLLAGEKFLATDGNRYGLDDFDAFAASPPCQRYSEATPLRNRNDHPDLIAKTRDLLVAAAKPYVIENVDGARFMLIDPILLCGTMFNLKVWRHRWFEAPSLPLTLTPPCDHSIKPVIVSGSGHGKGEAKVPEILVAMQVPWMEVRANVRQAIPPAYTEFIGRQLLAVLQ